MATALPGCMIELCGAKNLPEAVGVMAKSACALSSAYTTGIFLLDYLGSNLLQATEGSYSRQRQAEEVLQVPLDTLDDPVCFCVQAGQSVRFSTHSGMMPEWLREFSLCKEMICSSAMAYPLFSPGNKIIGSMVCFFAQEPKGKEHLDILCLYGSSVIAGFLEKNRMKYVFHELEEDVRRFEEKRNVPESVGDEIIGISDAMNTVRSTVLKVATADVPVLITGETGTGKSLLAKVIHKASHRRSGTFLEINCGALPPALLESELFGHRKGAFSGATSDSEGLFRAADKGTVFLDEIGELPVQLQSTLLHVLQEHKVRPVGSTDIFPIDVRIIAATNINLESAMEGGSFRRDLFHRLALVTIDIPSLSERREDIIPLAEMFIRHFCHKYKRESLTFSRESIASLYYKKYDGNIRELSAMIERAIMLLDENQTELVFSDSCCGEAYSPTLEEYMEGKEREYIKKCFYLCRNDHGLCADLLGIHQKTLSRKIRKHGFLA